MSENCHNCGEKIGTGILKPVYKLEKFKINVINRYEESKKESYCSVCGEKKYAVSLKKLDQEKIETQKYIESNMEKIPVLSTHSPRNWEYEEIGIVTGQSTTGTGILSEFTSSFSDFFGTQSGAFNKKFSEGEKLCFTQLRLKALQLGGNAVIATDIDYGEVGSLKGMLMVCAAGTAVKVTKFPGDSVNLFQSLNELKDHIETLNYLQSKLYL